jgi:S1-C subfamily serine protease
MHLNQANGIIVTYVTPGSPAALAGISSGIHAAGVKEEAALAQMLILFLEWLINK